MENKISSANVIVSVFRKPTSNELWEHFCQFPSPSHVVFFFSHVGGIQIALSYHLRADERKNKVSLVRSFDDMFAFDVLVVGATVISDLQSACQCWNPNSQISFCGL